MRVAPLILALTYDFVHNILMAVECTISGWMHVRRQRMHTHTEKYTTYTRVQRPHVNLPNVSLVQAPSYTSQIRRRAISHRSVSRALES